MNKIKSFFSLLLLCSAALINADCANVCGNDNAGIRSFILPRSQGSNTAMELVGWQDFIHQCDTECFYGVADIRFEYTRSFRPERIAEQLFGSNVLHLQGSLAPNRRADALTAEYFGLSQGFDGAICFQPRIDNFIVDFNFYFALDNWLCGLYFEAHLPIVNTRWTLFDCDTKRNNCNVNTSGTTASTNNCAPCPNVQINSSAASNATPFNNNYMTLGVCATGPTASTTPVVNPTADILQALSGTYLFGDMKTPWSGSRISSCRLKRTRLADLEMQLGWDFWKDECSHLGAFLEIVAPTGGVACSQYLFSPVVGNGGHFELGAGISGHSDMWSYDGHQFSMWIYGNVTHAFNKKSTRTFDFNGGPFTRYNLLKEVDASDAYINNIISGTTFTTRSIETNIRVKGDVSFKLAYNYCGFRFDLGYNLYGDSGERCKSRSDCNLASTSNSTITSTACLTNSCGGLDASRRFVMKGCMPVAASVLTNGACAAATSTFLLNTQTSSTQTAFGGCETPFNSMLVVPEPGQTIEMDIGGGFVPAVISSPLVPLSLADINVCSGLAKSQITNKVFGYAGYDWMDNCYTPFIGFLWEVEFASNFRRNGKCTNAAAATTTASAGNCSSSKCNFNGPIVDYTVSSTNANIDCGSNKHRGGISQWGVGFKGGLTF